MEYTTYLIELECFLNQLSTSDYQILQETCTAIHKQETHVTARQLIAKTISDFFNLPVTGIGKHRAFVRFNDKVGFKFHYRAFDVLDCKEGEIYSRIEDDLRPLLVPCYEYNHYITLSTVGIPITPKSREEEETYISITNEIIMTFENAQYNVSDLAVDDFNQFVLLNGRVCICDYLELFDDEMTGLD